MLSFLLSSILIILIKTCAGNSCVYYLATDRCEIKGLLLRDVLMSEITPVWSLNGPAVCVCVCVCMVYRTGTAHLSSLLLPWQSLHCTKPTPYGCYGNVPPFFLAVSMSQVYLPAGNDRWMVGVSVYVCFSFRGDKPRTQSLQKRQISKEPSRSLRVY